MRTSADRIEYVVRQRNDIWLIEHDGGQYGPYKDRHEAMFFAIDAALDAAHGRTSTTRVQSPAPVVMCAGAATIGIFRFCKCNQMRGSAFSKGRPCAAAPPCSRHALVPRAGPCLCAFRASHVVGA
jgi:hypothetical protein